MKKLFKWIQETLFGKKDALSKPCKNVYKELEKVKSSYISNEEFNSLTTEQQKFLLEKETNDVELQKNITSGNEPYLMGTSLDYETGKPLVKERPVLSLKSDSPDVYTEVKDNLVSCTNGSKYDVELKNEETGEIIIIKSGETVSNLKTGQYSSKTIIPKVDIEIKEVLTKNQPSKKPSKELSNTKKIEFFHPNDNKEIKLDEKKSDEIKATKKKRQYKKKGKK